MKVELYQYDNGKTWTFEANARAVFPIDDCKVGCLALQSDEDGNPKVVVHLNKIPARIDLTGKDLWILSDKALEYHKEPIQSYGDKTPSKTIFTREVSKTQLRRTKMANEYEKQSLRISLAQISRALAFDSTEHQRSDANYWLGKVNGTLYGLGLYDSNISDKDIPDIDMSQDLEDNRADKLIKEGVIK